MSGVEILLGSLFVLLILGMIGMGCLSAAIHHLLKSVTTQNERIDLLYRRIEALETLYVQSTAKARSV